MIGTAFRNGGPKCVICKRTVPQDSLYFFAIQAPEPPFITAVDKLTGLLITGPAITLPFRVERSLLHSVELMENMFSRRLEAVLQQYRQGYDKTSGQRSTLISLEDATVTCPLIGIPVGMDAATIARSIYIKLMRRKREGKKYWEYKEVLPELAMTKLGIQCRSIFESSSRTLWWNYQCERETCREKRPKAKQNRTATDRHNDLTNDRT